MSNANNKTNNNMKKSWTDSKLWWLFGWLFIFPVPLSTILLRSKKINRKLAIAVCVVAWVVYLGVWIYEELLQIA